MAIFVENAMKGTDLGVVVGTKLSVGSFFITRCIAHKLEVLRLLRTKDEETLGVRISGGGDGLATISNVFFEEDCFGGGGDITKMSGDALL